MRFDPFGDSFRQTDRLTNQLMSGTRTPMGMPMEVGQGDDGCHVALDLPGVDPSSVEITSERNVVADYPGVVHLADDGAGFAAACEQVVHHCAADRDRRLQPLRSRHEWDTIAELMARLLDRITRTRIAAGSASA
jgi:hypothetical protein